MTKEEVVKMIEGGRTIREIADVVAEELAVIVQDYYNDERRQKREKAEKAYIAAVEEMCEAYQLSSSVKQNMLSVLNTIKNATKNAETATKDLKMDSTLYKRGAAAEKSADDILRTWVKSL